MPFRKTINKVKAKIRKMGTTTYVRPYNPNDATAKVKPVKNMYGSKQRKTSSRKNSKGIGVGY